jgi:glycosyltransferase involved in cell wall biosynthesis
MPQSKRPLTILQIIAPHRYSGAERIATYLSAELRERGHRVVFACKYQEEFLEELAKRDLECLSTSVSGKVNPAALLRLMALCRRVRPDVIHTHLSTGAWWGSFAGRLLGIPVLAHVHALNTKTCFVYADRIAACSQGVKDHLVAQGVPGDRIHVIYNGIALPQVGSLRPLPEVRHDLGLTNGEPVVGVAAHLSPKKGQRYLIEATALLRSRRPNLRCYLVGEGDQREELEALAAEKGVAEQVRFMGYRPDAVDLMQAMDIIVLPSVAKEGLGVCLVEAGALGKPVVGSAIPGIDEVIAQGENGLLVPPGDPLALAGALDRLVGDAHLRQEMGRAGQERVARMFTLDRMADETEALYYEMVAAGSQARARRPLARIV